MHRFFLTEPIAPEMVIGGSDAHHIGRVLRMKPGDAVSVSDPDGQTAIAKILKITPDKVFLDLQQKTLQAAEPPVAVWLAQGLPKADKLEFIIQKAVELGAAGIIPVASHHAVVRYNEEKSCSKVERWQKIAAEAAKQCGRQVIPKVEPIHNLMQLLDRLDNEITVIMPYESENTQTLEAAIKGECHKSILVFVGPEGGFTAEEAQLCRSRGVKTVTLGPRILRAETAALATLAIVMHQCGDLGSVSR